VTEVRTIETIAIEKFFVPGKWLSSLRKLIYFLLMTSFSRKNIVSSSYRFSPDTIFFTHPGFLIALLYFYRFVIVIGCTFDKLDGFFISYLLTA
jgi:hypothetical protein